MSSRLVLFISSILFAAGASGAFAQISIVLDFQSLQHTGTGYTTVGDIYREDGFVVTGNGQYKTLAVWNTGASQYTGSTALFNNNESDTVIARDDGGQFDFLGIDLSPLDNPPESGAITFRGYRDSQLVATQDFQFNGALGLQHYTPPTAFRNLTEVRWYNTHPYHQFDNVSLKTVGGALPLRMSIEPPNSTAILDISHMHIGTGYTVWTSTDLVAWTNWYTFTAYSSTYPFYAPVFYPPKVQFYKLTWSQ